ncbi:MAG: TonB-dependent receptor [Sulfuricurvum sp.]|uniref:TonB-dependent receptor plug domain-containing protein n=1 Tax=Sulfuricurvum sp. TaxID=2025608 RepID=UPI0025EC40B6|nr:TonB-dependent receptor [Sulfuricurvum sp.]MBV5320400.1 TonB-dependent receptor [Sulfuricurvum sp.]
MKISPLIISIAIVPLSLLATDLNTIASLNDELITTEQMATQTNQNIDYQPFILSVWEQKDLIPFGVHTLKDALTLIPGIDMMADTTNNRTPVIRGSNPLAYGQTKLAIDGVVLNDRTFDSYNSYLDYPIELIQRIEVVRGSGSFIEGVNGYSGTINVITYAKDEDKGQNGAVFGSFGSDSYKQAGFWYTRRTADWRLSGDLFYQSNDATSPIKVTDAYQNPPGYAPLNSSQIGVGLSYTYDDFYLKGRFNHFTAGSAFGNLNALPNMEGEQAIPSWYIESGYTFNLTDTLALHVKAGIMEDGWESDARSLPSGTYNGIYFPNGYWATLDFNTRLLYGTISTTYTGIKNHTIVAGISQKYEDVINISSKTTERVNGGTQIIDYTTTAPFIDAGASCRHTNEIYINDTMDINDKLAFSLNLGGTKASDVGFSPYMRGSLIYQPYRQHILKLMVGNSYRLPSFQEMHTINNPARIGNPDLTPEKVTSYETQYLYKPTVDTTLGINLFYLQNEDQITPNTTSKIYQNIGERTIRGLESEFRGSLTDNDIIFLSYSYIRGKTVKGTEQTDYLPYASSHLLKVGVSYALSPQINGAIVGRYNSEKERRPNDVRKNSMDSFASYDLILGWEDINGFYVQGALKNANNAIYRYISPPATYADDYPVEGRTFWIRTGWKF